jgi:hypothetical protein
VYIILYTHIILLKQVRGVQSCGGGPIKLKKKKIKKIDVIIEEKEKFAVVPVYETIGRYTIK